MGVADELIGNAAMRGGAPPFSPEHMIEIGKLIEHNRSVPRARKISADTAIDALGLKCCRSHFDRLVRVTFGVSFGGMK